MTALTSSIKPPARILVLSTARRTDAGSLGGPARGKKEAD
jgi:hypothetical protein